MASQKQHLEPEDLSNLAADLMAFYAGVRVVPITIQESLAH